MGVNNADSFGTIRIGDSSGEFNITDIREQEGVTVMFSHAGTQQLNFPVRMRRADLMRQFAENGGHLTVQPDYTAESSEYALAA